jgi:hypothetical protein
MKRFHRRSVGEGWAGAVSFEAKKKRTEEDSGSCPMKYSTDVAGCRSDSLAIISYRDINQLTYVNLYIVYVYICLYRSAYVCIVIQQNSNNIIR